MANAANPMPDLPAPLPVSRRSIPIAGIVVDFYGIEELPADTESVSLLWLHHPRLRSRQDMADIASRCVVAVGEATKGDERKRKHGLVAAAFDQRNHGSRLVSTRANKAWREGNTTHAQDMFGMIAGTVADQQLLLDLVDSYIHRDGDVTYGDAGTEGSYFSNGFLPSHIAVTQHLMLGVSLGGHSGWQLLFADERVTAGVLVIGCPDYMDMMEDRARLSKLPTYTASLAEGGAPFFGSPDFSAALVASCRKHDPKGIVFGLEKPAWPAAGSSEERQLHDTLKRHVAGKRLLVCSGGADKLVPYRCTEPFLSVFKKAAETWPDLSLTVVDNVYEGIGHAFSTAMVLDAVQFVTETVADAPTASGGSAAAQAKGSPKTSKI